MFRFCEPCWRSRPSKAFYTKSNLCKECVKEGRLSYKRQYYKDESLKPKEKRNRVCNICIEELNEIDNFELQSSGKYRNECFTCRSKRNYKNKKSRGFSKEEKAQRNKASQVYRKRMLEESEEYREWYFGYQKKYRQSDNGKQRRKISESKRRAAKDNILDLMPDDWWNILLEICEYRCLNPKCIKIVNEKNTLSHDHIIPLSWENSVHSLGNSQVLCRSCNSSKNAYSDIDYRTPEMKQKLEAYDQLKLNSDIDIVL